MRKHPLSFRFPAMVWAFALALSFNTAWAQPLAEHIPADAILYVGWRGADDLGEAYDGSNLKALRDATDLPLALSQVLDLVEQANAGDEDVARVVGLIRTIGVASWRHPTAAYLQRTDNPDLPVRLVVLWRAKGIRGDELEAKLNQMAAQIPPGGFPGSPGSQLFIDRAEGLVSLTIGVSAKAVDEADATLAQNPDFKQTLAQVNPDGVLVVYADGRGLISLIDMAVEREGDAQGLAMWPKVRMALGLEGLNSAAWSAGFDGKDWRSDLFIDAPAPRTGLLSLLDGEPITDQELAAVPAEATWLLATRFDLGALLDSVRKMVNEIAPEMSPMLETALIQGNAMTGVDLEADLIRGLGSAWLIYTDPGATGSGMFSFCLVNPLNDAQKTEQALTSLQTIANALMSQAGGNSPMRVRFHTRTDHGMTLHSLGIPFIAPTWSVYDGRLYVGLYPQTVLTAGDRARAGKGSILTNEKFQAMRARLGGGEASVILFADLPRTAENSYQNLVMMTQLGSGMLAMFGADSMPMFLPPYARIEPYIQPAGRVAWSDDAGYHSRSISPFPGSMMLGPLGGPNATTMTAPVLIGTLLPALGAARRTARSMKSTTQCRGIMQAQVMFASENKEKFSNDIAQLLGNNFFTYEYAISPTSGIDLPRGFNHWDMEQQNQWVRENASYILIPDLMNTIDSEIVAVFERPDHSGRNGIPVGFSDGRAVFMDEGEARKLIETQTGKTLEELIERQQNYQSDP